MSRTLVAEKPTVDVKYTELKSVNMSKNSVENEYNSHLVMIQTQQLKDLKVVFLEDMVGVGVIYKIYNTIYAYTNSLRGNK